MTLMSLEIGGINSKSKGGETNGFWVMESITYDTRTFFVAGFIGQVAVLLYRVGQTEKRLTRSEERAEKRFDEVNQRIDGLRSVINQRLSDVDASIRQLNQNYIDHLSYHKS